MKLAFCLYKYFPFGGMQRNFLRIALECRDRGHEVRVYALRWEGEVPAGIEFRPVPVRGLSNIRRYRRFTEWVHRDLESDPVDRVVGFNKMPGLDVYYAGDPCFAEKARSLRPRWYRLGRRYRHFSEYERAVFDPDAGTRIMLIAPQQAEEFRHHYGTPEARLRLIPPGISADRRAPPDAGAIRARFRSARGLGDEDIVLLQIGSDFSRKGLDRSIEALASLPRPLRARTRLYVIGQASAGRFRRLARARRVGEQVHFLGGRDDVPEFLLGADLLLHPAHHESAGAVLLEAIVAGLPVIATEVCGFAHHVRDAGAGALVGSPFRQEDMNRLLEQAVTDSALRSQWSRNGLAYADREDLYSRAERAADIILEGAR